MQLKTFSYAKKLVTNDFKTSSKKATQKTAKGTGNFIGDKIGNKTVCRPNPESKETTIKVLKKEKKQQFISKFRLI